ncbi:MAG: extracellular solute-binding protein [Elusimicrobiota bacterium]
MKKFLACCTVVFALLVSVFSCSSVVYAEDEVVLQFWHFWSDPVSKALVDDLLDKYEVLAPGVRVEVKTLTWDTGYQEIVQAFKDGNAPDVLELGSDMISEFAAEGALLDLTSNVTRLRNKYIAWEPGMYDGKVYAMPWVLDTRALFYNKRLMSNASLDQNTPPETWTDLLSMSKKVHNPFSGIYGMGVNGPNPNVLYKKVLAFMWSNKGDVLSPDGKLCVINSKENRDALAQYLNLITYGYVGTQSELDQLFIDDKVGFWISGSWLINRLKTEAPNVDYGVALVPKPEGEYGVHASFYGGEYLVVNNKTKNAKYAVALAKFITWEENTSMFCKTLGKFFPAKAVSIDALMFDKPRLGFWKQLMSAYSPPVNPKWNKIKDVIDREMGLAVTGKKNGNQALLDADTAISSILK